MYAQEISVLRFVELCPGVVVSEKSLYFTHDTVMNRERPTFFGFCSNIPTCVIISSTFFTMGNREFLRCISLLPQGKSKTGIFQQLSKNA